MATAVPVEFCQIGKAVCQVERRFVNFAYYQRGLTALLIDD
jgi:hypothetical protein